MELIIVILLGAMIIFAAQAARKVVKLDESGNEIKEAKERPCPPHKWEGINYIDEYNCEAYKLVCDRCNGRAGQL